MKNKLNIIIDVTINLLIVVLFILAGLVAWHITTKSAAPWALISTYWITLTVKNGLDWIKKVRVDLFG